MAIIGFRILRPILLFTFLQLPFMCVGARNDTGIATTVGISTRVD